MKQKPIWFCLLLALFITTPGWGFTYITNSNTSLPVKWKPGTVPMSIGLGTGTSLLDGNTFNSSAAAAMTLWNNQLGNLQLQGTSLPSVTAGNGNDINEIVFASTVFGSAFDTNVLAVTTTWTRGNERTEADIIFNSARSWNSYRGANRGSPVDIQRVAVHELGHALGLDHPDEAGQSVSAIMNSHVGNLDTLAADDINGARRLYGPPGVPANDNFESATAIVFAGNTTQVTGFNTNATKQPGEPAHANNAGGHSVWWRWTSPGTGTVSATTQGSVFDTTLSVYTGSSLGALTRIAFSDDLQDGVVQYSTLSFEALTGTTYYFAVDGFDGDSGAVTLNLVSSPPAITTQPVSQTVTAGATASFSVTATGSSLLYQWSFNGSPLTGATASTLTLSNVQAAQAGNYSVTVANSFGNVTSSTATLTVLAATSNQAVATGHSITFFAGTGGTFQWQISTDGGSTWSNLSDNVTYAGATSDTLTISNASASLNGSRFRVLSTQGSISTPGPSFTLAVAPAFFPNPTGLAFDSSGNLVVADASLNTLQKIAPAGGVTSLAGTSGQAGSANGTGSAARFNQPTGLARSPGGVIHLSDTGNATLRQIATDGNVTTFAGSAGSRGNNDATGTAATFSSPTGLAFDTSGNLFVADKMNHTIRRITPAGVTSTYAGTAGVSGTGNGTSATNAQFNNPSGIAIDGSGTLYIADTFNHTIRKIVSSGVVTTFAGVSLSSGATDGTGPGALFNNPSGLALDASGNLYVADTANSTIRKITPAGVVTTFAGLPSISGLKDGSGNDAWFNQPQALAFDSAGNLFVADTGNAVIRKITPARVVTTLALSDGTTPPPTNPSTPTPPAPSGGGGGGGGGGAPSPLFLAALIAAVCLRKIERSLQKR